MKLLTDRYWYCKECSVVFVITEEAMNYWVKSHISSGYIALVEVLHLIHEHPHIYFKSDNLKEVCLFPDPKYSFPDLKNVPHIILDRSL